MRTNDFRLASAPLDGRSGHEVGRALLARLYYEETGAVCPRIRTTDRGKPYFEGSSLHFSISHTKAHAFCALAERPIGIDAEERDRSISLNLADKILSLLKLWVLKEAAAKLSGQGLRGYPNHTDFSPDDPRVRELEGCVVAILTD